MIGNSLKNRGVILVTIPIVFQIIFVFMVGKLLLDVQLELEGSEKIRQLHLDMNQFQWQSMGELFVFGSGSSRSVADQKLQVATQRNRLTKFFDEKIIGVSKDYISPEQVAVVRARTEDLLTVFNWSAEKLAVSMIPLSDMRSNRDEVYRRIFKVLPPFLIEMDKLTDANDAAVKHSIDKSHKITDLVFKTVVLSVLISLAVGVCLGYFFIISIKRPVMHIADNSKRLSKGEPLLPTLTGGAEFDSIDLLLHEISAAVKSAQKEEQALIENAADVVCFLDVDGIILDINASAERILGLRKNELVGVKLNELVVAEESLLADEHIRKAILSTEVYTFKLKLRRGQDSVIETIWSCFLAPTQERLFCVVRDVTEEEELARMKQDFVDMISHDLRSPLTSMGITFEIIGAGENSLSAAIVKEVERGKENIAALISFINDLLEFQKLYEGRVQLNLRNRSSLETILSASDSLEKQANQKEIVFDLPESDFLIECDKQNVVQALVNLLGFAIQASPYEGTVTVTTEKAQQFIRFAVIFGGEPIDTEMQSKMFEPYAQLSGTLRHGPGLRMAISKMIVALHGGEIGVVSEPDPSNSKVSTRFWFTLPATPSDPSLIEKGVRLPG